MENYFRRDPRITVFFGKKGRTDGRQPYYCTLKPMDAIFCIHSDLADFNQDLEFQLRRSARGAIKFASVWLGSLCELAVVKGRVTIEGNRCRRACGICLNRTMLSRNEADNKAVLCVAQQWARRICASLSFLSLLCRCLMSPPHLLW